MCDGTLNRTSQAPASASSMVQQGVMSSWRGTPGRYFEFRRRSRISSRTSVSMLQSRALCPLPAMVWASAVPMLPAPRTATVRIVRLVEAVRPEVVGGDDVIQPRDVGFAVEVGEDDRRLRRHPLADDLQVVDAHVLGAAALAVGAVQDEHVGALRQFEYLLAEHRVAGVGDGLAAYRHAVAEALQLAADVVHRERPEADLVHEPVGARPCLDVAAAVAGLAGDLRVALAGELLDLGLDAGRADDEQVAAPLGQVDVLQEEKRQAHEVVAVEVAEEDDLDVRQGGADPLEVGKQGRRRVEQVAAVGEEGTPVAPAGGEGVPGAQEGHLQHLPANRPFHSAAGLSPPHNRGLPPSFLFMFFSLLFFFLLWMVQADPRPMTWASPTFEFSTWRPPA